jgi:acid stress-induced BolA-like protein IbaG/YrbA
MFKYIVLAAALAFSSPVAAQPEMVCPLLEQIVDVSIHARDSGVDQQVLIARLNDGVSSNQIRELVVNTVGYVYTRPSHERNHTVTVVRLLCESAFD